ncbi:rRNA maturation RNase YbeY [Halomonas daqingensis]|uniref:Endoribonuclease YbeY n=1 Tax=Billgrantia desiderata TaxID=52021 RepID=A0AAW4YST2_9GAMM|nr:rRNA maturation RNase YbeY [Halomonas desiderata]MCE8013561.1 rRNA maturation RNase YbeY [Halomonas desiderata]MCE8030751.1 rRNA maturation RNase YbeY [Halomonas desiderata]MCE8041271.1 rRNA maturation RNase YbeY [Halomonas desiderata]MCE8045846.1 rRNA maturation RNase YbeY [Halomonas desiderata]MCE8051484.1 rRNA maturation RNase YbeY [Halomonas desiderata]
MIPAPIVDRQIALADRELPAQAALEGWIAAVLARFPGETRHEVTVRFVDADEGQALNRDYRGRDKPTNVLSFPFDGPPGISLPLLGDLVLCHPVVAREAAEQCKRLEHHYAHLVVHGMLHLLGHDHLEDEEAEAMEQLEREILADLDIADPYAADRTEQQDDSMDERL